MHRRNICLNFKVSAVQFATLMAFCSRHVYSRRVFPRRKGGGLASTLADLSFWLAYLPYSTPL